MATRKDLLTKLGHKPEQPFAPRRRLSTEENGRKYSLTMEPAAECAVYAVDGGIIRQGCRCDKLVLVEPRQAGEAEGEIFVELKGRNVSHAIAQLEATLGHAVFSTVLPQTRRKARIVARSYPRNTGDSVLERAKIRFRKQYRCDLRTRHSGECETW